jgi:hypothetical protein
MKPLKDGSGYGMLLMPQPKKLPSALQDRRRKLELSVTKKWQKVIGLKRLMQALGVIKRHGRLTVSN